MKNIIFALISLLILLIIIAAYQLSKFFSVSRGEKIARYDSPAAAVLIMDMQKDFSKTSLEIIDTVNKAIDHFTQKNITVIYIKTQYGKNDFLLNFIRKNSAVEGSDGTNYLPELKIASQNEFTKDRMDAFSNEQFNEFLIKNRIDNLYITGIDGCYCIDKTIRAALNRGYKVTIITDATASKKKAEFEAVKNNWKEAEVSLITTGELN